MLFLFLVSPGNWKKIIKILVGQNFYTVSLYHIDSLLFPFRISRLSWKLWGKTCQWLRRTSSCYRLKWLNWRTAWSRCCSRTSNWSWTWSMARWRRYLNRKDTCCRVPEHILLIKVLGNTSLQETWWKLWTEMPACDTDLLMFWHLNDKCRKICRQK